MSLLPGAVVVFDPKKIPMDLSFKPATLPLSGSFFEITGKSFNGEPVMRNTVAPGATVAFLDYPKRLLEVIKRSI